MTNAMKEDYTINWSIKQGMGLANGNGKEASPEKVRLGRNL